MFMIIVITYLLINSWDFIFKRSMRIIHLKKSVGSVPCSIVYLLRKRPMTLSTWIRTLAIPFVVSTSTGSSCSLPLVKVATTDFALLNTTLMYSEASISHHHVARNKLAQDTTVFCFSKRNIPSQLYQDHNKFLERSQCL